MKINAEQYGRLIEHLDLLVRANTTGLKAQQALEQRLAAIEADVNVLKGVGQELLSGQDKLLQSHAALEKASAERYDRLLLLTGIQWDSLGKAIEQIKGELSVRRRK